MVGLYARSGVVDGERVRGFFLRLFNERACVYLIEGRFVKKVLAFKVLIVVS